MFTLGRLLQFRLRHARQGAAIFLMVLGACGKGSEKIQLSKSCAVSEDQRASFDPRVEGFPIRVSADEGFSSGEKESIQAVVLEWNGLGRKIIGTDLFQLEFRRVPDAVRRLDPNACSNTMGNGRDFYIVRDDSDASWTSRGFKVIEPGTTIRCYEDGETTRQIIYLLPSRIGGLFDEAVSHELGHSIGLDHSCNNQGGSAEYIGCKDTIDANTTHPYYKAVMYPKLKSQSRSQNQRIRSRSSVRSAEVLESNDEMRANCIVGEP